LNSCPDNCGSKDFDLEVKFNRSDKLDKVLIECENLCGSKNITMLNYFDHLQNCKPKHEIEQSINLESELLFFDELKDQENIALNKDIQRLKIENEELKERERIAKEMELSKEIELNSNLESLQHEIDKIKKENEEIKSSKSYLVSNTSNIVDQSIDNCSNSRQDQSKIDLNDTKIRINFESVNKGIDVTLRKGEKAVKSFFQKKVKAIKKFFK